VELLVVIALGVVFGLRRAKGRVPALQKTLQAAVAAAQSTTNYLSTATLWKQKATLCRLYSCRPPPKKQRKQKKTVGKQ
jgi:hypothetical protein